MEQIIRGRLQSQIGTVSVDWGATAQGIRPPRVVLYRISGQPDYDLDGPTGTAKARVQADCYGTTVGQAKGIAASVKLALSGWRDGLLIMGVFLDSERDLPPDTGAGDVLARVSMDFIINFKE